MLSFFPARDVEEPVTKEHLRAEMADLRTEMADFRMELRTEMAELRTEFRTEMAAMEVRLMDSFRSELRDEVRRSVIMNFGMLVAFAAALIAAVRL